MPPLLPAVVRGDAAITSALLKAGAKADVRLAGGLTLLMLAARTGDPATLGVLLERGADPNAADPAMGETALMWAAAENHADAVRVLVGCRRRRQRAVGDDGVLARQVRRRAVGPVHGAAAGRSGRR